MQVFRPSLTLAEIHTIIASLPAHETAIISKLRKFTLKAEHGLVTPARIKSSQSSQSLTESLGFTTSSSSSSSSSTLSMDDLMYAYENTPQILTPQQLTLIKHHRYTNDLMTPQEEAEYEQES